MRNNCPRTDKRGFPYRHARTNGCIAADRSPALYSGVYHLPVGFSLQRAIVIRRARISVVDKHHTMPEPTPCPRLGLPSQMKVCEEILQRAPTEAFFWISNNSLSLCRHR